MRSMSENWPEIRPRRHADACSCRGCRVQRSDRYVDRLATQSLSTALRHAQDPWEDAWEAGRSSTTALPAITVPWSAPISLKDLKAGKVGKFGDRGKLRVYRIHPAGSGRPLYIGMVHGATQSVAGRIADHLKGKKVGKQTSETYQLSKALREAPDDGKLMIRFADIDPPARFRNNKKFFHGVEMLLQAALKPQIDNPGSLTFEDDTFEDDAEAIAIEAATGRLKKAIQAGRKWGHRAGLALSLAGPMVPGPIGQAMVDLGKATAGLLGADANPTKKKVDIATPSSKKPRVAGSPPPPKPPAGPWAPDIPPGQPNPFPGSDPTNPNIPRPPRPPSFSKSERRFEEDNILLALAEEADRAESTMAGDTQ